MIVVPMSRALGRERGVPDRTVISGESRSHHGHAMRAFTWGSADQAALSTMFASRGPGARVPLAPPTFDSRSEAMLMAGLASVFRSLVASFPRASAISRTRIEQRRRRADALGAPGRMPAPQIHSSGPCPKDGRGPDCKLYTRHGHLPALRRGERYGEADHRPGPRSMGRWSELERRFD